MVAATGRSLLLARGGNPVAALVAKTMSIGNEAIDVTTDDDLGFRTLLEASGTRSIDMSFEGVMKDDVLLTDAADPATTALIKAGTMTFASGTVIAGDFRLNDLEITGEVAGRIQFSGTLQSSGAWTLV